MKFTITQQQNPVREITFPCFMQLRWESEPYVVLFTNVNSGYRVSQDGFEAYKTQPGSMHSDDWIPFEGTIEVTK